jgi:acetolactate synthase I/II/III large subunit
MIRAADILAQRLYQAGCRHAFGMPGGEVLTLVDALEKAGIRFVLVKHENAGGFMAEGVFQRTGAPAVLVATLGPGATNAVNVVANAEQDRVPLIVLTGCVDADEALTYNHQVMDHRALFASITKATFTLSASGAQIIADKALNRALSPRPGPVLIDVPITVADARSIASSLPRADAPMATAPAQGAMLDEARGWIAGAQRPLILVGLDAMDGDAPAAIRDAAERLNAPVITTYKAKGVLPEDHALAMGGAGLSPLADKHLLPLVRAADVIIAVGYDPIEMRPGWRNPWDLQNQRVIDLMPVANTHDMHAATLSVICDPASGLRALMQGLAPSSAKAWPQGEPDATKAALAKAFAAGDEWGPAAVVATARAVLPRETIASVDSGAHRILLSQMWETYEPRTLMQSTGLCTMGCALPLALGAKLVEPDRPVVAFTGDGGLLMTLGDLSTLSELKLPVIVVVFCDASLALIEKKQRERQLPNAAVDFAPVDFPAIANAFGGHGVRVSDSAALDAALRSALQRKDQFTLIACEISRGAYDGRI